MRSLYLENARADVTTCGGSVGRKSGKEGGGRKREGRGGSAVNAPDGSPAEGSEGAHLCPPLVKRLQGSQMPDCEPLPVDTYPKCQSRREPQTHFTL